jgi:hypothetical protein
MLIICAYKISTKQCNQNNIAHVKALCKLWLPGFISILITQI